MVSHSTVQCLDRENYKPITSISFFESYKTTDKSFFNSSSINKKADVFNCMNKSTKRVFYIVFVEYLSILIDAEMDISLSKNFMRSRLV